MMRSQMSINASDLIELDLPEPQVIWGPGFCTRNLIMVYGWRGVAKTRFCMKLAHTIAAGGTFLAWRSWTPRKVLYVEGELGLPSMRRRYLQIQAEAFEHPKGEYFRVLSKDHCGSRLWNISDPEDQAKYDKTFGDAECIFIDNIISSVFPMHSRDDEVRQWERIIPWLHKHRDAGRMVVLVHHTGKSGEQLGSSIKENYLDTSVCLKAPTVQRNIQGCEFDLTWKKTRDAKKSDVPDFHIELIDDEEGTPRWSWKTLDDDKAEALRSMKFLGMSRRDAAKELNLSLREVSALWPVDAE